MVTSFSLLDLNILPITFVASPCTWYRLATRLLVYDQGLQSPLSMRRLGSPTVPAFNLYAWFDQWLFSHQQFLHIVFVKLARPGYYSVEIPQICSFNSA